MSIITLCTDFGTSDSYAASMKGVILGINPSVSIIDATHDIPPHNIPFAAFVLNGYYRYFPKGTVHIAVVDPGVGGPRLGIVVKTKDHVFVGPDNGVFSYVLMDNPAQCYEINTRQGLSSEPSATFHGRDVFAPAAARMSLGWDSSLLGAQIKRPVVLDIHKPRAGASCITGEVIHIDHFGNIITNVHSDMIPADKKPDIVVKRFKIKGIKDMYEQCAWNKPCALINSLNLLEIAVSSGSAHGKLGVNIGDKVKITWE